VTQAGRLAAVARHDLHRARTLAPDVVGGPARGRVVLILAAVLALNGADTGTISATTGNWRAASPRGQPPPRCPARPPRTCGYCWPG